MTFLRPIFLMLVLVGSAVQAADPAQIAADEINAERAKRNLEHFTGYLSKCPENEIRCL